MATAISNFIASYILIKRERNWVLTLPPPKKIGNNGHFFLREREMQICDEVMSM